MQHLEWTPDTRTFFEISRKMPPPLGGLPFQLFTTTNYGMSAYGTVPAARSFTFAATNTRERWDDVECLAHLALFVWNAFPSSFSCANVPSLPARNLDRSAGHFLTNLKACGRDPSRSVFVATDPSGRRRGCLESGRWKCRLRRTCACSEPFCLGN